MESLGRSSRRGRATRSQPRRRRPRRSAGAPGWRGLARRGAPPERHRDVHRAPAHHRASDFRIFLDAMYITQMTATAAILGCAGYTGQETLDRVLAHPALELVALGSDSLAGQTAGALDPRLSRDGDAPLPAVVPQR